MNNASVVIRAIENQIENTLHELELREKLDQAFEAYRLSEAQLNGLGIGPNDPEYIDQQRVLSYCLMRQGNVLRQLGKPEEALALGDREILAARLSKDDITLARALMSNGTNLIVAGKVDEGLKLIDTAKELFEKGTSYDHKQGLGWYLILQADLANAGLTRRDPAEVAKIATQALDILEPIENWPGVARAYGARSIACEKMGDHSAAKQDNDHRLTAESKIDPDMHKD
jgi:tetratricopeptide (TPR) repeat protein